MSDLKSYSSRFQMSYKKKEAERFVPMEYRLMEELGIDNRCDLHKVAIENLDNPRIRQQLAWV